MDLTIQNKHSILNQLEWDLFLKKSSDHSLFKQTPEKIFNRVYRSEEIETIFDQTELFMRPERYEELNDIRLKLASLDESHFSGFAGSELSKGAVYDLEPLSTIVSLLETVFQHFEFLNGVHAAYSPERVKEFKTFFKRNVLKEFRSFVSPEGEVDYFKHPKLKSLYKAQLELEGTIRSTLGHLKNNEDFQQALQFASHDVINDKYVLPVKSDTFSSKLGSIVARSESGRTLYVEPLKIRNFNRERLEILLKIDQIIHEIARDFCSRLAPWGDMIDHFAALAYNFDEYDTRSRFALEFGLSRPELCDHSVVELDGFFHPLIKDPVKNTLDIKAESKGILISGPNTGGKTAAIKAIGLACLFAKQGLFVPAGRAKLRLFEKIFYFGNDQQSLPEGLSSFAAEVQNYSALLKNLGESNLVIIDEIFNSTSSEEASALAIAFFNEITKSPSSKVIVSTHHQTLKTLAHSREDYISCHVGFDSEKNAPTYRLVYGFPGKSMALEVFKEMTSSDETCQLIYKEALKKLDNKMLNYEKLLRDLSQREEKLNRLISTNQTLRSELQNQKESAKGVARLKIEEEVSKVKTELSKIAEQARQIYIEAKQGNIGSKGKLEKKISSVESKVAPFSKKSEDFRKREESIQMPKPAKLEVGQKYFCSFVNQTVTLKELKKNGEALVSKGSVTIKCPSSSLWTSNVKPSQPQVVVSASRESKAQLEYDCRGMRLSEFQSLVENVLPELMSGSVPFVNFIHGHGNGTLKDWLRSFVSKNNDVEWDKTESGNDGETRLISP